MIMLDTNICIYILKERPLSVLKAFEQEDELSISAIVFAELWSGIEKSPAKKVVARSAELEQFLSMIKVLPWDESAGREYAILHTLLKKSGKMIGNMDLLIASHAKSLNMILATNNVREFERIDGLQITNWI